MKTGLVVIGIAIFLVALWALLRSGSQARQAPNIPDDLDGQVLKQLATAGSDLSKPHQVEFFLYFPDEARASEACRELTVEGYSAKVDRAATGPQWLCFATKPIVPAHATMVAIRARMNALAQAGNGEYDGWGTPIAR
jgi:hypothetical protein